MFNVHALRTSPFIRRFRRWSHDFLYYTVPELLLIFGAVTVLLRLIDHFFFRR